MAGLKCQCNLTVEHRSVAMDLCMVFVFQLKSFIYTRSDSS